MEIKILGTGCPNCQRLERIVREAAAEMGVAATFDHVTDMRQIMTYPILGTPGLVIDGKVMSSGRIPSKSEIVSMLATTLSESES